MDTSESKPLTYSNDVARLALAMLRMMLRIGAKKPPAKTTLLQMLRMLRFGQRRTETTICGTSPSAPPKPILR